MFFIFEFDKVIERGLCQCLILKICLSYVDCSFIIGCEGGYKYIYIRYIFIYERIYQLLDVNF